MRQAAEYVLQKTAALVSPLAKVAEIGPGWGAIARVCSERGVLHVGIDANLAILRNIELTRRVCAFVPPLPLRTNMFDVVIASHIFEHCSTLATAQELLAELARIVRIDGCIVIVAPDVLWAGRYFWDCDYTHNFATSSRRLSQMFVDQALEVVALEYVFNHLPSLRGYVLGSLIHLLPYRLIGSQPGSYGYSEILYRFRTTFSRSVLIIGRKSKS